MTRRREAVKGLNPTLSPNLSKRRKARLLGVALSSCYTRRQEAGPDTVTCMNEIRDIYARYPFYGYRRITQELKDAAGFTVNHKRVYRLMKHMGLQAIYPKCNLSKRRLADQIRPYLLREKPPQKPHDAWCVDITYIKMQTGTLYLTALIDVVSRCVVGHHVSTCLETESCLRALESAVRQGLRPQIVNSDQGCQFTSQLWAYNMALLRVEISMDGKGRAIDNIPIERFWRTIKYEEVYLKTYESVPQARREIAAYIDWYNHQRRHSGLDGHRPFEVMTGQKAARFWPFKVKTVPRPDGYVEKAGAFTHKSTGSPSTHRERNLSLQIAA